MLYEINQAAQLMYWLCTEWMYNALWDQPSSSVNVQTTYLVDIQHSMRSNKQLN